jgi:hypothetical protein
VTRSSQYGPLFRIESLSPGEGIGHSSGPLPWGGGWPEARRLDDGKTMEVLRVCTDGTPNANSFLYGRVKRIPLILGYQKVINYTPEKESGASLRPVVA